MKKINLLFIAAVCLFLMHGTAALSQDELAAVKIKDNWGYIDRSGALVIKPTFKGANPFSDGLGPVKAGDNWGYIDAKGKWVIQPHYNRAEPYSEGLARVIVNQPGDDKWIYINKEGKQAFPEQYSNCMNFNDGMAAARIGKTWGFIDKSGKFVIENKY